MKANAEDKNAGRIPDVYEVRLHQLADNIYQDLELLKEYEDSRRYEDDPRRRKRYDRQIAMLKQAVERYQGEYDSLVQVLGNQRGSQVDEVATQLNELQARLNMLLAGQTDLRQDIHQLQSDVLTHIDIHMLGAIAAVVSTLREEQLNTVNLLLVAIDQRLIAQTQIEYVLKTVEMAFTEIQSQKVALPENHSREIINVLRDPTLDAAHKLKVTIPLIPFILNYEGEISLRSGMNLQVAWKWLESKVRRE